MKTYTTQDEVKEIIEDIWIFFTMGLTFVIAFILP